MPGDYRFVNHGVIGAVGDHASGTVELAPGQAVGVPRATGPADRPAPGPTFGLVTVLPEELHAMRSMLDGSRPVGVANDRATYLTGTLPAAGSDAVHRVVLTMSGDVGTSPAAAACADLARSFPTVGFLVMLGIAAGVPRRRPGPQVLLGDIVVGTWGVVDYDHVRELPGGPVLRQPFPRPSPYLVRATAMLRAEAMAGRRTWEPLLEAAGGSDPMARRPRTPQRDGRLLPAVHHGRIGSGDRSLSNPRVRDEIAERYGIVAFEMEGAGVGRSSVLAGVEWLVVRGVSDFGGPDAPASPWRPYASFAAAAYVRAMLGQCRPVGPRGGQPGDG
jgi:nucleoside phosphorylase